MLLDSNGCPTEGQIMGPLARGKVAIKDLVANFDAFKFPSSEMVQFRALVTPCMPRCQPVECVYQDFYGGDNTRITSYGKRRRREAALERWQEAVLPRNSREVGVKTGEEVLVTHAFMISDKFAKKSEKKAPASLAERPGPSVRSQGPNYSSAGSHTFGHDGVR